MLKILIKLNKKTIWLYLTLFILFTTSAILMASYVRTHDPYALEKLLSSGDRGSARPMYVSYSILDSSRVPSDLPNLPSYLEFLFSSYFPGMSNYSYMGFSIVETLSVGLLSPIDFSQVITAYDLPPSTESIIVTNGPDNTSSINVGQNNVLSIDMTIHSDKIREAFPDAWWTRNLPEFMVKNSSALLLPFDRADLLNKNIEVHGFFYLDKMTTHDLMWRYSSQVQYDKIKERLYSQGISISDITPNESLIFMESLFTIFRLMGWIAIMFAFFSVVSSLMDRDRQREQSFIFFADGLLQRIIRRLLPLFLAALFAVGVGFVLHLILKFIYFHFSIYEPSPSVSIYFQISIIVFGGTTLLILSDLFFSTGRSSSTQRHFRKIIQGFVKLSIISGIIFVDFSDRVSLLQSESSIALIAVICFTAVVIVFYVFFVAKISSAILELVNKHVNSVRFPKIYSVTVLFRLWKKKLRNRMVAVLPVVTFLLLLMAVSTVIAGRSIPQTVIINGAPITLHVSPENESQVNTRLQDMGYSFTSVISVETRLNTSTLPVSLPPYQEFLGIRPSEYAEFYKVEKISDLAKQVNEENIIIDAVSSSQIENSYPVPFYNSTTGGLDIVTFNVVAAVERWPMITGDRNFAIMEANILKKLLISAGVPFNVTFLVSSSPYEITSVRDQLSGIPGVLTVNSMDDPSALFFSQFPLFFLLFTITSLFSFYQQSLSRSPNDELIIASLSFSQSRRSLLLFYFMCELALVVGNIYLITLFLLSSVNYLAISDPLALRFIGNAIDPYGVFPIFISVIFVFTALSLLIEGYNLSRRPLSEIMKYKE